MCFRPIYLAVGAGGDHERSRCHSTALPQALLKHGQSCDRIVTTFRIVFYANEDVFIIRNEPFYIYS